MKFIEETKFRNSTCISDKKIVDKTKFRNLLNPVNSVSYRGNTGGATFRVSPRMTIENVQIVKNCQKLTTPVVGPESSDV